MVTKNIKKKKGVNMSKEISDLKSELLDLIELNQYCYKFHRKMVPMVNTEDRDLVLNVLNGIDSPVVTVDARRLVPQGYCGKEVRSILDDLVKISNGNLEKAENGIVIIENCDELALTDNSKSEQLYNKVHDELVPKVINKYPEMKVELEYSLYELGKNLSFSDRRNVCNFTISDDILRCLIEKNQLKIGENYDIAFDTSKLTVIFTGKTLDDERKSYPTELENSINYKCNADELGTISPVSRTRK